MIIRALINPCGLVKFPREKEAEMIKKKEKTDVKTHRERVVLRTLRAGERGL